MRQEHTSKSPVKKHHVSSSSSSSSSSSPYTNNNKDTHHLIPHPKRTSLERMLLFASFALFLLSSLQPSIAFVNFKCPSPFGYYEDLDDCSKYYVCVFGEALHENCSVGLYYSKQLQTCDWPRSILTKCIPGQNRK